MFDASDQAQLTLLLQGFIMYKAQSEQSINEIFIKLGLMHTQIEEIDSTFALDERLQDIVLWAAVDQKLYTLPIVLLESKQELGLQETICVLKKVKSKIRLTNKSAIESANYTAKVKCDDNQEHHHHQEKKEDSEIISDSQCYSCDKKDHWKMNCLKWLSETTAEWEYTRKKKSSDDEDKRSSSCTSKRKGAACKVTVSDNEEKSLLDEEDARSVYSIV